MKRFNFETTDLGKMASRIVVVCDQYLGSQNSHKCLQNVYNYNNL